MGVLIFIILIKCLVSLEYLFSDLITLYKYKLKTGEETKNKSIIIYRRIASAL